MNPHPRQGNASSFVFIVGAPRCGTTFLARHLRAHPDVCFSRVKEPHFFYANDLRGTPTCELRQIVERDYLDRYFPDREGYPLLAEGSVTYLYAPQQLEPVLRLWPDAKFIVAVRDPMQMVPSLHQRLRCIGDETERDFNRAWKLVAGRRNGFAIPRRCVDPRWLDYWESGRLGHYVTQFFEAVGRERCFVSVFDDLKADPAAHYRKVLDFVGLPDDHQTDFSPERESSDFKLQWLQHLLKRPPRAAISLLGSEALQVRTSASSKPSKSNLGQAVLAARSRILKWNKKPLPPVSISPVVRTEMQRMFARDLELLQNTISRDLGHWLGGNMGGQRQ